MPFRQAQKSVIGGQKNIRSPAFRACNMQSIEVFESKRFELTGTRRLGLPHGNRSMRG